jgi:hypothetical protein
MLRKRKSQGAGEPKAMLSLSFVVPLGQKGAKKKNQEAHRSARHIDAESTAAAVNVPEEVKRRAGKRACSPFKELWR